MRRIITTLLGVGLLAIAACGVPIDQEPQPLNAANASTTTQPPTTVAGTTSQSAAVYFLRDDRLERQDYPVAEEATLADTIGFALEPPAEGSDPELRTAVPPGTSLRNIEVTDGTATIDLTEEINDVSGEAQKEAFAQIVFTALAFEEVEQVRFLIEGEVIDAPTDNGNLAVITAEDYDKPLNPR